eukprot:2491297-Amphidinium_carterae.1
MDHDGWCNFHESGVESSPILGYLGGQALAKLFRQDPLRSLTVYSLLPSGWMQLHNTNQKPDVRL